MASLFLTGWALLSGFGMRGWVIVPLGFVVGTMTAISVGFLLAVARAPTGPWVVLSLTVAVGGGSWLAGPGGRRLFSLHHLVAGMMLLAPLVLYFRGANLVKYHIDSFRYLVASGLLARDSYELVSLNLLEKRGLAAPVVHSLSSLFGESYLRSHSPTLALAVLALVVWVVSQGAMAPRGSEQTTWTTVIAALAALLLLTNNRMVWNAFYVNDHLHFGAALLVICAASWLLSTERAAQNKSALLAALLVALPALVVTRPEGFIAGGLAIAPLVLSPAVGARVRSVVLLVFSAAVVVWFGFITVVAAQGEGHLAISSAGPAVAGLFGLMASALLLRLEAAHLRRAILQLVEGALWLALLGMSLRDPDILLRSLRATYENVVMGAGSWGWSLIALGLLGLLALVVADDQALIALRFPLTAMLPVFFLLAYLRDGAYRVGNGDSLNRMLMQVLPLAVLYLAAACLESSGRERSFVARGSPTAHADGQPHPSP
jgi:hypothetical protein